MADVRRVYPFGARNCKCFLVLAKRLGPRQNHDMASPPDPAVRWHVRILKTLAYACVGFGIVTGFAYLLASCQRDPAPLIEPVDKGDIHGAR